MDEGQVGGWVVGKMKFKLSYTQVEDVFEVGMSLAILVGKVVYLKE